MLNIKKVIAALAILGTVLEPIGKVSPFGISFRDSPLRGQSLLAPRSGFEGEDIGKTVEALLAEVEEDEGGEPEEKEKPSLPVMPSIYEIDKGDILDDGVIIERAKRGNFDTILIRNAVSAKEDVKPTLKRFLEEAQRADLRVILHMTDADAKLESREQLEKATMVAAGICGGIIFDDAIIRRFPIGDWKDAIAGIRSSYPGFLFFAHVRLNEPEEGSIIEFELQEAGFDFVFDIYPFKYLVSSANNPLWLVGYLKSNWKRMQHSRTLHFTRAWETGESEDGAGLEREKFFAVVIGLLPGAFLVKAEQLEKGLKELHRWIIGMRREEPFDKGGVYLYDPVDVRVKRKNENIIAYSRSFGTKHGLVVGNASVGIFHGTPNLVGHKNEQTGEYSNPLGLDRNRHYIIKDEFSGKEYRLSGEILLGEEFIVDLKPNEWRVYTIEAEPEAIPVEKAKEILKGQLLELKGEVERLAEEVDEADEPLAELDKFNKKAKGIVAFIERMRDLKIMSGFYGRTMGALDEKLLDILRHMNADKVLVSFGEGNYYSLGFSERDFLGFVKRVGKNPMRRRIRGEAIDARLGSRETVAIYIMRDADTLTQFGNFSEEDARRLSILCRKIEEQVFSLYGQADEERKKLCSLFQELDHDLLGNDLEMSLRTFFEFQKAPETRGKTFTYIPDENAIESIIRFLRKLEKGLEFEALDIGDLVREVAEKDRKLAEAKGLKLSVSSEGERSEVVGFRIDLFSVFDNLIRNAIKYTDKGGVSIFISNDEKDVIIKIKDTGIGMDIERAFAGTRGRNVGKRKGTGRGFQMARNILRKHRGRLIARSIPGDGTACTVIIPLKEETRGLEMENNVVISDKEIRGIETSRIPSDKRIAVIEFREGDSKFYAGNLFSEIGRHNNEVEVFLITDDAKVDLVRERIEAFGPSAIFAPYGDTAIEQLIKEIAGQSDKEITAYFYESSDAPFDYNLIQPFSNQVARYKEAAIRCHESQVARLPLEEIAELFAMANAHRANRMGIGDEVLYAEFYKTTVIKGGVISPIDTSRMFIFGKERFFGTENLEIELDEPIFVVSPHPDDCEISCGGLVRSLRNSGAMVFNWVFGAGGGAFIPHIDGRDAPVEEKRQQKKEMRERETRNAAACLGILPEQVEFLNLQMASKPIDTKDDEIVFSKFRSVFESYRGRKNFTIVLPDPRDLHARHRLATKLALSALIKLTKDNKDMEVRLVYYTTPWSGEFNAYYYSGQKEKSQGLSGDQFSEAQLRKKAVALIGGEIMAGFGRNPESPEALGGPYAERFLMRRFAASNL